MRATRSAGTSGPSRSHACLARCSDAPAGNPGQVLNAFQTFAHGSRARVTVLLTVLGGYLYAMRRIAPQRSQTAPQQWPAIFTRNSCGAIIAVQILHPIQHDLVFCRPPRLAGKPRKSRRLRAAWPCSFGRRAPKVWPSGPASSILGNTLVPSSCAQSAMASSTKQGSALVGVAVPYLGHHADAHWCRMSCRPLVHCNPISPRAASRPPSASKKRRAARAPVFSITSVATPNGSR
jgi:hypothetical protein